MSEQAQIPKVDPAKDVADKNGTSQQTVVERGKSEATQADSNQGNSNEVKKINKDQKKSSKKNDGKDAEARKDDSKKKPEKKGGDNKAATPQEKKGTEMVGITVTKTDNFPQWYQEVVLKAELIEYYTDISGFYILRPASMYIWNTIRQWFEARIQAKGVEEASFPMFLSSQSLEREKSHVEGFAPELVWVTKCGDKDLEVPVAVRPTSEALMYPYFAKWIRSHRDLPLKLNQWNSVVRWEAKQTTPFLRAREFMWQEGHTAHLTEELAGKEVLEILELYAGVYEQLLAVPVVRGRKTEKEKFAGGYYTTTVEGYIPATGRGIQGATSHCLGQNFSKMFDIIIEDPEKQGSHMHVWQNSWGLSTRVIGVMVMIHSDDKGLVLPPRVAKIQAILIPVGIVNKTSAEDKVKHAAKVEELRQAIKDAGVRIETDLRDSYTPAWKFNDWELKGVPLRLEFGPKDAAKDVISYARRDSGEKGTIPLSEVSTKIPELLETIQKALYDKADKCFREHRLKITNWDEVLPALDSKNLVIIPHCLGMACEDKIKELTVSKTVMEQEMVEPEAGDKGKQNIKQPSMGMKSLCIPHEQPEGLEKGVTKCLNPECSAKAEAWCMFGRSY